MAKRQGTYSTNIMWKGHVNILASAKKAGIERTVYTSSVAAIGVGASWKNCR